LWFKEFGYFGVLFSLFFPSGYYGATIRLTIILTCIGFDLATTISWEGVKGQGDYTCGKQQGKTKHSYGKHVHRFWFSTHVWIMAFIYRFLSVFISKS
jgi:hypothetical protein